MSRPRRFDLDIVEKDAAETAPCLFGIYFITGFFAGAGCGSRVLRGSAVRRITGIGQFITGTILPRLRGWREAPRRNDGYVIRRDALVNQRRMAGKARLVPAGLS